MNVSELIFLNRDPFADDDDGKTAVPVFVHVRIQQRNGRKSLTTIQGLPQTLNLKQTLKDMKRSFSTNGTIIVDDLAGQVVQLQGDKRKACVTFLTEREICQRSEIKVHGY